MFDVSSGEDYSDDEPRGGDGGKETEVSKQFQKYDEGEKSKGRDGGFRSGDPRSLEYEASASKALLERAEMKRKRRKLREQREKDLLESITKSKANEMEAMRAVLSAEERGNKWKRKFKEYQALGWEEVVSRMTPVVETNMFGKPIKSRRSFF